MAAVTRRGERVPSHVSAFGELWILLRDTGPCSGAPMADGSNANALLEEHLDDCPGSSKSMIANTSVTSGSARIGGADKFRRPSEPQLFPGYT